MPPPSLMVHICIPNAEWDVNMGIRLLYVIDWCSVTLFIPFTCIYVSFHLISKLKDFVTRCDYAKGERGCERDQTSAAISDCQWVNCIISSDTLFLSHTVKVKSDSSSHYDLLIAFYVKAHLLYFISHFICKQIFRVKTYALSLLLSASKDSRCMVRGKN